MIIKIYSSIYYMDKQGIEFLKSVFDTRLNKTRSSHHVNCNLDGNYRAMKL